MLQTIYIDVLIILNVYVNYFLLRTAARLTRSPLRDLRCIAASFYGSLFSLLMLVPELPFLVTLLIKSAAAVTIVAAAFGVHSRKRLFINTAAFFAANFIFAGAVYAVYTIFRPDFMHFSNGGFYIDFSLLVLVLTTAVLYFIICLLRRFSDRVPDGSYKVILRTHGKVTAIDGLADSGNGLVDCFSGRPVVICGGEELREIIGSPDPMKPFPGSRLIPYSTISDSGLIPVFRPDEILIINTVTGERKSVDASVGVRQGSGKAIFNPKLLKY